MNLPTDSESCSNCKKFYPGYGFNFDYRFTKYAYIDTGVNLFPGSGNSNEQGAAQEALAGFKLGSRVNNNWGLFFNLRNGFIHYNRTFASDVASTYSSAWRYAVDLGGTVEYYASHKSTIRFNAGTTLIHYLHGYADPLQPIDQCSVHRVLWLSRQPLPHYRLRLPLLSEADSHPLSTRFSPR